MEKPNIGMKHLMEQYGIEFQNLHLWDINSLKWVQSSISSGYGERFLYNEWLLEWKYQTNNECESKRCKKCKNPTTPVTRSKEVYKWQK